MTTTVTVYNRGPHSVHVLQTSKPTGALLRDVELQPERGVDLYCYSEQDIRVIEEVKKV